MTNEQLSGTSLGRASAVGRREVGGEATPHPSLPGPHFAGLRPQEIREWLIRNVAERMAIEPSEIDVRAKFATYGLDSRAALEITGELENWSGFPLDATLVWDYPCIEAVVEHLVERQKIRAGWEAAGGEREV